MCRATAVVAALIALLVPATAMAAECGTPDARLDAVWSSVSGGWLAGDAAYSAPLPGRRDLWLFGDSLIGRGDVVKLVRNAAVLSRPDGTMTTVAPTDSQDLPFADLPAGASTSHWLWPSEPRRIDGTLWVFFAEIARTDASAWGFRFVRSWLAKVDQATLRVRSMRRIGAGGIIWGAATVVGARYVYVFGVHDHGNEKHLHVARVPRSQGLTGTWRYWDRHRWAKRPEPEAHVLVDVSNQVSVLRVGGSYVLITQDPALGAAVRAYRAARPAGPWRPLNVLYHAVPRTDTGVTYNAQAHPELPGPGLVMTFSVMESTTGPFPGDPANYRPRFFRVPWTCLRPVRSPTASSAAAPGEGTIPSRPFGESRLAADARGNAIVAWIQAPDPRREGTALYVSRRRAGGVFGAPVPGPAPSNDARVLGLAVAPGGRAALAWRAASSNGTTRIFAARGTAESGFDRGRVVARRLPDVGWTGATEQPGDPAVAVADDGATVVAWLAPSRCGNVVRAWRVGPGGSAGRFLTLSRGCPHASTLRAALDRNGDGVVAWRSGRSCGYGKPCHFAIQAAPVHHGVPGRAIRVSRHPVAALGLAVAAGGGRSVVAWRDAETVTRERALGRVLATVRSRGRFGRVRALSTSNRISGFPAAAAGPRGELLVAWQALGGAGATVQAALAGAGAGFATPAETGGNTSGFGYQTAPFATFGADGRATVGWLTTDSTLQAATATAPGGWQPLATAPRRVHAPALAGSRRGETIALWTDVSELGQLQSLRWQLIS